MKIAVCVKHVPEGTTHARIDPQTKRLDRSGEGAINPFDTNAVEEALRIKEAGGGEVLVVSMGPQSAQDSVRKALAMGADAALLVTDDVAAEAGQVKYHFGSQRAGCMLYLHGDSGTTYLYVHLNNDVGTTNDNRGRCAPGTAFAPGLNSGTRVAAGEPIGFVGDSGDADGVEPHLHFELHPGGGAAVNPFAQLNRAWRLLFAAPRKGETSLWLKGSVLAQQAEAFKVQVSSLGVRRTGLKLNGISRSVSLGVSPFTVIEKAIGELAGESRATVWTEIAPVTLAAQLGKPGALVAERVLLSR